VKRIEALLRRINRHLGVTMLVSSHHIPSTMRMADQVVMLLGDRTVAGSPGELSRSPTARMPASWGEIIGSAA
jgi:ABC-type transporter Mla maintaining outer membrane lipid asymmetry ATPase subunit MlaF